MIWISGRKKSLNLAINNNLKYITFMRKLISMMMTCTLLFISIMPTVSLAAMCKMTVSGASSIEQMAAEYAGQYHQDHKQSMHHHEDMMHGDWQTCRIECGCGCHRHLDSLPHLLSPHMMSESADLPEVQSIGIAEYYAYSQIFYIPLVQLPPPDLS